MAGGGRASGGWHSLRAQSAIEVVLVFVCVIAALLFMAPTIQRAAQGTTKSDTDALGWQFSLTSGWGTFSRADTVSTADVETQNSCWSYRQNVTAGGGGSASAPACTP